ncbi:hypothetical protein [Streptomyces badius]
MITLFAGLGWTQERTARLTGMSRPAVSERVAKARPDGPAPPPDITLDQHDAPWPEGRLRGPAEAISATLDGGAHCTHLTDALGRGRKQFTPQNVDALRRLFERNLTSRQEESEGASGATARQPQTRVRRDQPRARRTD